MSLRASTRRLAIPRRTVSLKWGGVLAAGVAAVSLRVWSSGHVLSGDIRTRYWNAHIPNGVVLRSFSSSFIPNFFALTSFTTSTMAISPPQAPPKWNHTPAEIAKGADDAIAAHRAVMDKVSAVDPKDANFETVCPKRFNPSETNTYIPGLCMHGVSQHTPVANPPHIAPDCPRRH